MSFYFAVLTAGVDVVVYPVDRPFFYKGVASSASSVSPSEGERLAPRRSRR
jgi:hypothetical protein